MNGTLKLQSYTILVWTYSIRVFLYDHKNYCLYIESCLRQLLSETARQDSANVKTNRQLGLHFSQQVVL